MHAVHIKEQIKAELIGDNIALVLLDYPGRVSEESSTCASVADIPDIHSCMYATLEQADNQDMQFASIFSLLQDVCPDRLYGHEEWRDVDWVVHGDKVSFEINVYKDIRTALWAVFVSQVSSEKRDDLATLGWQWATPPLSWVIWGRYRSGNDHCNGSRMGIQCQAGAMFVWSHHGGIRNLRVKEASIHIA